MGDIRYMFCADQEKLITGVDKTERKLGSFITMANSDGEEDGGSVSSTPARSTTGCFGVQYLTATAGLDNNSMISFITQMPQENMKIKVEENYPGDNKGSNFSDGMSYITQQHYTSECRWDHSSNPAFVAMQKGQKVDGAVRIHGRISDILNQKRI